jgi:superfamily I DNA/RNA helicase
MATDGVSDVESALTQHLTEAGFSVFSPRSDGMPSLVAAHPSFGLIAIDLVDHADGASVGLNRKVARLRNDVPEVDRVRTRRLIVGGDLDSSDGDMVTRHDAASGTLLLDLPARPMEQVAIDALATFFAPRVSIDVPRRKPMTDEDAADRADQRLLLDATQSAIVRGEVDDVLIVTGPPGSGKTLVLAARAKWLAAQHPDWRIVLLCYNRLLVPYLESLVWGHANISVHTFGKFAARLRVRVSLDNEEWAQRDVERALKDVKPTYHALLIDEWQDFMNPWTRLALATVKPGHGGVTLAGDPLQALYRDGDGDAALVGRKVEIATLTRPYRSTRQILEVTSALDEMMDVTGRDGAFEGKPVDLVWAENTSAIASAVGRDVHLLLVNEGRKPQDIGVLVTRKWDMGTVVDALKNAMVPVKAIYPNKVDEFDLADPCVKVMTVHSAKGYEFDVVFLVGMEHLADPDGSERAEREGRAGYVGSTRAKDQLVLMYSRENVYLDRIRALPAELVQQWIWPDDYPEVG